MKKTDHGFTCSIPTKKLLKSITCGEEFSIRLQTVIPACQKNFSLSYLYHIDMEMEFAEVLFEIVNRRIKGESALENARAVSITHSSTVKVGRKKRETVHILGKVTIKYHSAYDFMAGQDGSRSEATICFEMNFRFGKKDAYIFFYPEMIGRKEGSPHA